MSDSPFLATGYSAINRAICNDLASKNWEPHYCGWMYRGLDVKNAMFKDGETLNFWVHSSGSHQWGKDVLQYYINKIKPSIFFTLCDSFMYVQEQRFGPISNWIKDIDFSSVKSVFYFPTDGEPFPEGCELVLRKFAYNIAMSKFGQRQVKDEFGTDVDYIPHFVDTNIFYKSSIPKDMLKAKWNGMVYRVIDGKRVPVDLRGKKICLTVAKNQGRKMIDRTITLASRFKDDEDILFLCKFNPADPAANVNTMTLAKRLGCQHKIAYTASDWFSGFSITEMNEVYNLADLFFLTTSGEGWGIPTIEAMSCELPVIVTKYTTTEEIVNGDERQMARVNDRLVGSFNVDRALVDIDEMEVKIRYLLEHDDERVAIGESNRARVVKEYSKEAVLPLWNSYFQNILTK